jgi:uncharacterized MAPEG superfamily protein
MVIMSLPLNRQLGPAFTAGDRDEPHSIHGVAGRLVRACDNHFEALVLFTAAVTVVMPGGANGAFTQACASVHLLARIA